LAEGGDQPQGPLPSAATRVPSPAPTIDAASSSTDEIDVPPPLDDDNDADAVTTMPPNHSGEFLPTLPTPTNNSGGCYWHNLTT